MLRKCPYWTLWRLFQKFVNKCNNAHLEIRKNIVFLLCLAFIKQKKDIFNFSQIWPPKFVDISYLLITWQLMVGQMLTGIYIGRMEGVRKFQINILKTYLSKICTRVIFQLLQSIIKNKITWIIVPFTRK